MLRFFNAGTTRRGPLYQPLKTIHRSNPKTHFTIIPNDLLQSSEISARALGILVKMLSMPDDWRAQTKWLATHGKDGIEGIRSALKELERLRYMKRIKAGQGERGRFVFTVMLFTDTPGIFTGDGLPCPVSRARQTAPGKSDTTKNPFEKEPMRKNLNDNNPSAIFSMPSIDVFINFYKEKMKIHDKGGHLPLINWLFSQHSYCADRWVTKPPNDWRNFTGTFARRYSAYWEETKEIDA